MTARFAAAMVVAVAAIGLINAHTIEDGRSFVITGSRESGRILSRNKRNVNESAIKSLHITSVIESRFARVTYESEMENNKDVAKEMIFSVRLPTAAFITEFHMVVGGIRFDGKVKEKETAKKQYEQAVKRGHSAGLVVVDVRETHTFDISANVPPHSKVDFHLVYQQLLERKLGQYEHVITVNPEQPIEDFVVDVYITERSGITTVSAISPKSGDKKKALTENLDVRPEVRRSKSQAKISFKPTPTEVRRFLRLDEDEQKFTVRYDVTREVLGGEIKTRNGYFVHFFAPENLPVLAKRVVFVIDTSGSMRGRKIQQTKTAFTSIIKELRETDKFNILTFASHVTAWRDVETGVVDVTKRNIRDAIDHVAKISASGSTNLNGAILDAASLLERVSARADSFSSIIVLTDGNPTTGATTSTSQIRLNAQRRINGRFSLFCLGFGNDVDQDFLKRLSAENNGIARKIYQDSDADLQLEGFFQEVATPLLLHLRMTYTGANFTDVSQSDFNKYFKGSEKVVVGTFDAGEQMMGIQSIVRGSSGSGEFVESVTSTEIDETFQHWYKDTGEFDDFIERLWAYFSIRKSLEKRAISEDRVEKQEMMDRIMSLALKYSFVTPLTSLVVTLPEDEVSTNTDRTTMRPPPPHCYNPIDPFPGNPLRHPIQCPVILNRSSAKKTTPRSSRRQTQRIISSMAAGPRSTSARIAMSRFRPRLTQYGGGRPSFFLDPGLSRSASYHRHSLRRGMARRRRPPTTTAPAPWDGCTSDPLTALTGTLKLPANQQARHDSFCTLTIRLRRGSWIDLYIEIANTTKNSVVITSKGQTVFQHEGGNSGPRYISLEHRKAKLEFKVYGTDRMRPGIVITYSEFIPNVGHSMVHAPNVLPESPPTCGKRFSASEHSSGTISSPNYPKVYPDDAYCQWSINMVGVEGHHLKLSFGAIDIESSANGTCLYDKLIIRIGEPEQDRIFCGFHTPENVIIESSVMYIFFITDEKLGASGFQMSYQVVPVV